MKVLLMFYSGCKYWNGVRIKSEQEYLVDSYEVCRYTDNEASEKGITEFDENGEYLVLHFENGEEKIFRNTHVEMC